MLVIITKTIAFIIFVLFIHLTNLYNARFPEKCNEFDIAVTRGFHAW